MTLTSVHVVGGLLAIVAGYVALFVLKGGTLHRRSGAVFVWAMVVMGVTGSGLALVKSQVGTSLGGLLAGYMVITAMLTVRRPSLEAGYIDRMALLVALSVGITYVTFGALAVQSATGKYFGYPAPLYFVLGGVTLLAAVGDVRVVLRGPLEGNRRLARHLWRMCFAMFIATGSFFLGQMQVFPPSLRIFPLLAIPAFLPLVLMVYWLVRVRATKGRHRVGALAAARPAV